MADQMTGGCACGRVRFTAAVENDDPAEARRVHHGVPDLEPVRVSPARALLARRAGGAAAACS